MKRLPENPEYAEMRHVKMTLRIACGRHTAVRFYLSHGLVRVCEKELFCMGKNN